MANVRLPTGEVINVPDDASPSDLAQLELYMSPSAQPQAAQAAPEAPQRSLLDQAGRSVGLAARMPLQAAGSTVGMIGDALNSAINLGGQALGYNPNLQMPSRMIQSGIDAITPVPENTGEKIGDFAGTLLASGLRGGVDPAARAIAGKFAPRGLYDAPAALAPSAQAVTDAQKAGIAVSPTEAGAGLPSRLFGVFAGKKGTNAALEEHNVKSINDLSRQAAGLPAGTPLTNETLTNAIKSTYDTGYKPITELGQIPAMPQYGKEVADAQRSLQGLVENPDAKQLFKQYGNMKSFSADRAMRSISQLREAAGAAFDNGDHIMGKANKAVADALENNIGNHLDVAQPGGELLSNFQNARSQLSKQYLVRDAIKEGTGNADITKYGQALNNGAPLTDELLTMGRIANQAPFSTKMPTPGSPMAQAMPDIIRGAVTTGLGHLLGNAAGIGIGTGAQIGMLGARHLIPTALGQRLFAQPAAAAAPAAAQNWRNALPTGYNLGTGLFNDQSY